MLPSRSAEMSLQRTNGIHLVASCVEHCANVNAKSRQQHTGRFLVQLKNAMFNVVVVLQHEYRNPVFLRINNPVLRDACSSIIASLVVIVARPSLGSQFPVQGRCEQTKVAVSKHRWQEPKIEVKCDEPW